MAKTVLITGASSGIGEETAKALLAVGHTVYAGARRVDRMKGLAEAGAHLLSLDVTDDASMTAAVQTVLQEAGLYADHRRIGQPCVAGKRWISVVNGSVF